MQIQLTKNLQLTMRNTSRLMGLDEQELINRALTLYLKSVEQVVSLHDELRAWDIVSDEAFRDTEQNIWCKKASYGSWIFQHFASHTLRIAPSRENGLDASTIALVFHIRAIDKQRLKLKIGNVEKSLLVKVNQQLKKLLALQWVVWPPVINKL